MSEPANLPDAAFMGNAFGWLSADASNALLPSTQLLYLALPLSWCVVLAALAAALATLVRQRLAGAQQPLTAQQQRHAARIGVALGVLASLLPGGLSPVYWLGLAFQLPSMSLLVLCAAEVWSRLHNGQGLAARWASASTTAGAWRRSEPWLSAAAVLLGWALLMDTFALLPVQLYAWGLEPAAVPCLALVAVLPWLSARAVPWAVRWVLPLALLLFVALRLPTGNVWDAVLDPGLWLALHWRLWRAMRPAR